MILLIIFIELKSMIVYVMNVILMYRKANIFALNVLLNMLSAILTISFFLLFKSLIV